MKDDEGGVPPDFEVWYVATYPRLARSMAIIFRSPEFGDELAAEAMARAFGRWGRLKGSSHLDGWVYAVALNYGKRQWRRRHRERQKIELAAAHLPRGVDLGAADLDLWRAIDGLPPRVREAVTLRYIDGLSEADTASAMGIRPGTVGATLHRARQLLKAELSKGSDRDD